MAGIKLTPRERMKYTYADRTLRKFGLTERHLMRKFGGTPGIDKLVLDTYPDCEFVKCYTRDNRKFVIAASLLQEHGKVLNFGHGAQYFAPKELWDISGD